MCSALREPVTSTLEEEMEEEVEEEVEEEDKGDEDEDENENEGGVFNEEDDGHSAAAADILFIKCSFASL